jgi:hypothetical protein
MDNFDKSMRERANKQMDESEMPRKVWNNEIFDKLYYEMPEDQFVNFLSQFIIKENKGVYYLREPRYKAMGRVTFIDNKLVKYEKYGAQYGIPGTGSYHDVTFLLRIREEVEGSSEF